MIDSLPRFKWSHDLTSEASISSETAVFLLERGLPEFVPGMTLEFGAYEADSPDFVIGEDFDAPILVKSGSDEVWIQGRDDQGDVFVNSSVALMEQFIARVIEDRGSLDSDTWTHQITLELSKADPLAFAADRNCMWPHVIDRFALN